MPAAQPPAAPPDDRTAADVMTAAPRTCSPFSTIIEAALIFRDADCGAVPVLDDGKPVGVLTDRDVALALIRYPELQGRPVSDVMSRDVITILATDRLDAVEAKLTATGVRRLLVADPLGQLVGIVSRSDLPPAPPAAAPSPPTPAATTSATPPTSAEGPWAWARPGAFWGLLKATASEWSEDKVPRLGAALAFYSVLSLAPLLLIAIAVAALVFGEKAATGQLDDEIQGMVGKEGAEAIQQMLKNAHKPGSGPIAALVGFATLLLAASGVFGQLQDSMNTIWEVQPKPGRGVLGFLKDRFFSFAMVLGTGFLLLTSLVLSTTVAAMFALVGNVTPALKPVLAFGDFFTSAVVVILLFALIYKVLPDARIAWRDVWVGAGLTTVLFLVGKALIGIYLARSSYGSGYGAAGSLVVLLVWIYYSSLILFFGAEFTQVYANRYGSQIRPAPDAEPVTDRMRAQQGIPKQA